MENKMQIYKRLATISSILVMAALLLTACNGAISFQGAVQPNDQGGITISGGAQPEPTQPAAPATGLDQTTLILIVVGFAVLVLILLMLVRSRSNRNQPPS